MPYYFIRDIGQIFNYNYLFFWEEPEKKDYLYGFIDLQPYSKDLENEFKETLRDLIPEDVSSIRKCSKTEILLSATSSSSKNPLDNSTEVNWKLKPYDNSFSREPLKGKRCVIPVSVQNTRDTILLPPSQLNSVKLIDQQILEILQHIKGNAMIPEESKFRDKIFKDFDKKTFFLCRDILKEGITKPRILLKWIQEVLIELIPEIKENLLFMDIYNDYFLILEDGSVVNPKRGHGLGMANALTTLVQIILFNITLNRLESYEISEGNASCAAFNDDFEAGFDSENLMEAYYSMEGEVFEDYQMLREPKKSFYAYQAFVLCENYFPPTFNAKESYVLNEVFQSFAACNIVQAKQIINNLYYSIFIDIIEKYLEEIIAYWGNEFYQEECYQPLILGGWIDCRYKLVNFSLIEENIKLNLGVIKACQERKAFLLKKGSFKRKKTQELTKKQKEEKKEYFFPYFSLGIDKSKFDSSYLLIGTIEEIEKRFIRYSKNPGLYKLAFDNLYRKRQNIFNSTTNDCGDIACIKEILFAYSKEDFLIKPSQNSKFKIEDSGVEKYQASLFYSKNPITSYINFYNIDIIDKNVDSNPLPMILGNINPDNIKVRGSEARRQEIGDLSYRSRELNDMLIFNYFNFAYEDEIYNNYLDPQGIAEVAFSMGYYCIALPPFLSEEKKKLIELRDQICKIRNQILILLKDYSIQRIDIFKIIIDYELSYDEVNDLFKPEEKEEIKKTSISEVVKLRKFEELMTLCRIKAKVNTKIELSKADNELVNEWFWNYYMTSNHQVPAFEIEFQKIRTFLSMRNFQSQLVESLSEEELIKKNNIDLFLIKLLGIKIEKPKAPLSSFFENPEILPEEEEDEGGGGFDWDEF